FPGQRNRVDQAGRISFPAKTICRRGTRQPVRTGVGTTGARSPDDGAGKGEGSTGTTTPRRRGTTGAGNHQPPDEGGGTAHRTLWGDEGQRAPDWRERRRQGGLCRRAAPAQHAVGSTNGETQLRCFSCQHDRRRVVWIWEGSVHGSSLGVLRHARRSQ